MKFWKWDNLDKLVLIGFTTFLCGVGFVAFCGGIALIIMVCK